MFHTHFALSNVLQSPNNDKTRQLRKGKKKKKMARKAKKESLGLKTLSSLRVKIKVNSNSMIESLLH